MANKILEIMANPEVIGLEVYKGDEQGYATISIYENGEYSHISATGKDVGEAFRKVEWLVEGILNKKIPKAG